MPASAASDDAFGGMQGHFFTSPQAHELILQSDVAKDLADIKHIQPAALLGQQIILRYAGRQPLGPPALTPEAMQIQPQTQPTINPSSAPTNRHWASPSSPLRFL